MEDREMPDIADVYEQGVEHGKQEEKAKHEKFVEELKEELKKISFFEANYDVWRLISEEIDKLSEKYK